VRIAGRALCGLLVVATFLLLPEARADEPMLALRLAGGESAIYAVSEITRVGFEGEETLVVVTGSGSDSYAMETVQRIEFLFYFSSVEDPMEAAGLIDALHLFQNQPNPFSPETQIGFELPRAGKVALAIYAPDGRLVRTLVAGEHLAGRHTVRWDGFNDAGRQVSGGVYFYRLQAPGIEESRRMILLP
jgi:hypothetical protein